MADTHKPLRLFIILSVSIAAAFSTAPVLANEKLRFSDLTDKNLYAALSSLPITQENLSQPKITEADLNEDGMMEYILMADSTCQSQKSPCRYFILSSSANGETILLGDIEAFNLALGTRYHQGVRDIIAFQDPLNDFTKTIFGWAPRQMRYRMKSDE